MTAGDVYELRRQLLTRELERYVAGGGLEKDFAVLIGVSPTYLARLKSGLKRVGQDKAIEIDDALSLNGQMRDPLGSERNHKARKTTATTPLSRGVATGVTQDDGGLLTGQIWSLPYIQEDQLQYLTLDNGASEVVKLDQKRLRSLEDINADTDKAVELFIDTPLTPKMSRGDTLIMRAPPKDGALPLRHLPVVVRAPSGDLFMIEFENEKVHASGLVVVAYTVDWIPKRPPVRAVYQIG